jgi:hypothetical protein
LTKKRLRVYECYWAHFRGGNPLERIVGKPPTESRRHAVGHKKGLGVSRPGGLLPSNGQRALSVVTVNKRLTRLLTGELPVIHPQSAVIGTGSLRSQCVPTLRGWEA